MKPKTLCVMTIVLTVLAVARTVAFAEPVDTAVTYQGRLTEGGSPATGEYDFVFVFYGQAEGGSPVGGPLMLEDQPVNTGLFTARLDFGSIVFNGEARWLEIRVRPGDSTGGYITLAPRQEITPTPYAMYALDGTTPWQTSGIDIYYDAGNVGIGTVPTYEYGLFVEGTYRGIYGLATDGAYTLRPFGVVADLIIDASVNSGGGFQTWINTSNAPNIEYVLGGQFHVNDDADRFARALSLSLENEESGDYGLEILVDAPAYAIYSMGSGAVFLNGKVGIGTLYPTDQLEVDGSIRCLAGGFRFPDGTVQTTADVGDTQNTLDQAYDEGGVGNGRTINADSGAVHITGPDGFVVDSQMGVGTSSPGEAALAVEGGNRGIYGVAKSGTASVRPFGVVADLVSTSSVTSGGGFKADLLSSNSPNINYLYAAQLSISDDADRQMRGLTITSSGVESDDYGLEVIVNDPGYAIHAGGTGRIYLQGDVGIGTSAPSEKLHVQGNICATGTIGSCSDGRFKERVAEIPDALTKVDKLRGVYFEWRADAFADRSFEQGRQVGFIAQEVERVLPEAVARGSGGFYSVDYGRVVPTLVEAIKELHLQVDAKDARMAEQERQIAALWARLERLERAIDLAPQADEGGAR